MEQWMDLRLLAGKMSESACHIIVFLNAVIQESMSGYEWGTKWMRKWINIIGTMHIYYSINIWACHKITSKLPVLGYNYIELYPFSWKHFFIMLVM